MNAHDRAIAIVGVGAILPDAMNATEFWNNLLQARYSIAETPRDRWSIADYYDPDPTAPDKTYSKIGAWVRGFEFDWKRFKIPPKVAAAMDEGQQWAVTIAAQALEDYGYPQRPLDTERTGVILGTAMGGEQHYLTTQRIVFPEYAHALEASPAYQTLPPPLRAQILDEFHAVIDHRIPPITEDSMPGELPNIVSGRVANVLNLRGPNFITDAAWTREASLTPASLTPIPSGRRTRARARRYRNRRNENGFACGHRTWRRRMDSRAASRGIVFSNGGAVGNQNQAGDGAAYGT